MLFPCCTETVALGKRSWPNDCTMTLRQSTKSIARAAQSQISETSGRWCTRGFCSTRPPRRWCCVRKKLPQAPSTKCRLGCSKTNCHAYDVFVSGVAMMIAPNTWQSEPAALESVEGRGMAQEELHRCGGWVEAVLGRPSSAVNEPCRRHRGHGEQSQRLCRVALGSSACSGRLKRSRHLGWVGSGHLGCAAFCAGRLLLQ